VVALVQVLALHAHGSASIGVTAVDLDQVADRDVRAGEGLRVRRDHPIAGRPEVHDVQVAPGNAILGDDEIVDVGRGAVVPGIRARGVAGGRAEDAADADAVGLVGRRALGRAVTRRGEDDRVPEPSVEPAGAGAPELLPREDRRAVDRRGPMRTGDRADDRVRGDRDQHADQDDNEQTEGPDRLSDGGLHDSIMAANARVVILTIGVGSRPNRSPPIARRAVRMVRVEATTGFEPVNRGFADLLHVRAHLDSCVNRAAGAAPEGWFRCELPTKLPTRTEPRTSRQRGLLRSGFSLGHPPPKA